MAKYFVQTLAQMLPDMPEEAVNSNCHTLVSNTAVLSLQYLVHSKCKLHFYLLPKSETQLSKAGSAV